MDALAAFYTNHVFRLNRPDLLGTILERAQHRNATHAKANATGCTSY